MKIAVMSDVHDNIWNLEKALKKARQADVLIFCGDFCAPFTLKQIAEEFEKPIHVVFGNNDGDKFLLSNIASGFDHVTLHGEFADLDLGGLKIAVNHYPEIAEPIAASGRYDAVFYGHNHIHKIDRIDECDFINPGEVMGRFGNPTFVMYDTATRQAETVKI